MLKIKRDRPTPKRNLSRASHTPPTPKPDLPRIYTHYSSSHSSIDSEPELINRDEVPSPSSPRSLTDLRHGVLRARERFFLLVRRRHEPDTPTSPITDQGSISPADDRPALLQTKSAEYLPVTSIAQAVQALKDDYSYDSSSKARVQSYTDRILFKSAKVQRNQSLTRRVLGTIKRKKEDAKLGVIKEKAAKKRRSTEPAILNKGRRADTGDLPSSDVPENLSKRSQRRPSAPLKADSLFRRLLTFYKPSELPKPEIIGPLMGEIICLEYNSVNDLRRMQALSDVSIEF